MAKLIVFGIFLVGLICIEAQEDSSTVSSSTDYETTTFLDQLTRRENICKHDGVYAIPGDCEAYIFCRRGLARRRQCPEGYRFDSQMYCTRDESADCGVPRVRQNYFDDLCPQDWGIFANPYDCHKFVVCVSGRSRVRSCPEGKVYQEGLGCLDGDECPPSNDSQNDLCLRDWGIFAYPDDCHKFVVCISGRSRVRSCPEGKVYQEGLGCLDGDECPPSNESQTLSRSGVCDLKRDAGPCELYLPRYFFNTETGTCERFLWGGCRGNENKFLSKRDCERVCLTKSDISQRNDTEDFVCRESGRYANPNNCDSYIECSVDLDRREMELVQCPVEQHYNMDTKRCEDKCTAQCDQDLACTCGWPHCSISCKEPNGVFPVPTNCKMYMACSNNTPRVKRCREGKAFDPESRECVDIEETNCVLATNDIFSILLRRQNN